MANTKIPPELVDDQVFGRRNLIINGDMRVAQRGTSATTLQLIPIPLVLTGSEWNKVVLLQIMAR